MRAGSLSHDDVTKRLRKRFVPAWTNTDGEAAAGGSFAHKPSDPEPSCIRGNGEHNIQILFVTPIGEIFHTLSGYLSAPDLVEELDFGEKLFQAMLKVKPNEREALVVQAHKRRLIEVERRKFDGPLGDWAKRRALADHRFAMKHPLLAAEDFKTEDMVGRSKSFFGSSRGGKPDGRIGTPRPRMPGEEEDGPDARPRSGS